MAQLAFNHKFIQKFAAFQPFVCFLHLSFATTLSAAPAQAPAPDARLDAIFEHYQSLKDFKADFKQVKQLTSEGLELKSNGTLTVSFGRALLWDVKAPGRLTVFLSPELLEIRAGEGARQTKNKYDLKSSAASEKIVESLKELTALLSMNREEVAKQYVVGSEGEALTLTPKKPRQFARVRMTPFASANAKAPWIDRIDIDEVSGDKLLLDFDAPVKSDTQWIDAWKATP